MRSSKKSTHNRNTLCKLSRRFSMALSCFQVSSPALDLCQCHRNVTGCVIVSPRQTLWRWIRSGLPVSAGLTEWGTNTTRRMFIFRKPYTDCTLSYLINAENFARFETSSQKGQQKLVEWSGVGGKLNLSLGWLTEVAWLQPLCTVLFDDSYTSCCLPAP